MRQTFIIKCARFFITKCDAYYELRQYTHLFIHLNSLINVLQDWLSIIIVMNDTGLKAAADF